MNILAVDTTGEALSLALKAGDRVLAYDRVLKAPHDETILAGALRLLARAGLRMEDLDAITAASGPGRFTGIRIGMAFAAVAASRLKIPALAVSRFEGLASRSREKALCAALDGFRGEKYFQLFKSGRAKGKPVWVRAEQWAMARQAAEREGYAVLEGSAAARDLLAPASRRLAVKRIPRFEPLYLKPATYENSARVVR